MAKYNFCVKCGGKVKEKSKAKFSCTKCGYAMYKTPSMTTAGIIMRSGKILFVKRRNEPYKGWWDLVGGFLDEKETPEQCMVREAKEETGLVVKPLKILGFHSDKYRDGQVIGCFFSCRIVSGKERAGDDASAIKWFGKNALPKNVAFPGMRKGLKEFVGAKFTKKVVK